MGIKDIKFFLLQLIEIKHMIIYSCVASQSLPIGGRTIHVKRHWPTGCAAANQRSRIGHSIWRLAGDV